MPPLDEAPASFEAAALQFPQLAAALSHPLDRRRTLKLLAAALASGGLVGCDPGTPDRGFVSAVVAPEGVIPGVPDHYATAHVMDGYATGIVVTHQMGRPTKVEGNPLHPASLGATDVFSQAAILDFYDPDRANGPLHRNGPVSWQGVQEAIQSLPSRLATQNPGSRNPGDGLRILTGTITSPTLGAAIQAVLRKYPGAVWHQWDAIGRDNERDGAALAYGAPVSVLYAPDRADVVLALDSDLLSAAPGHLAHARGFAARRNPTRSTPGVAAMSRIYAAEPTPDLIGLAGDHRFILSPPQIEEVVGRLSAALLRGETASGGPDWLAPVLADLRGHQGRALIHLGPDYPAEAHAAVSAMNEALGGRNQVFTVHERPEYRPRDTATDGAKGVQGLLADMQAGRVRALLIVDVNPAYQIPGFAEALGRVPATFLLGQRADETAIAAEWYVPIAHPFEDWGDARAVDGTATILQPQAMPLYGGANAASVLGACAGEAVRASRDRLRQTWRDQLGSDDAWNTALANGVVPGTGTRRLDMPVKPAAYAPPAAAASQTMLLLRPDPHLWDGRGANNPWLQELPRTLTKTVWDNPLLLPPQMAHRLGLGNNDEVVLSVGARSVTLPVWVQPGQAPDVVVGLLGFGRSRAGVTGNFVGTDLFVLRGETGAVQLRANGTRRVVASTEHHRDIIDVTPAAVMRHGTLAQFEALPAFLKGEATEDGALLYRRDPGAPVAWGMSIDLNACIGCNACVVACQSENNVPVVGREEVIRQREMHWLRIDRSYQGGEQAPDVFLQPVLCMHCEQAPCEPVCPVGATSHDSEGLNVMVYNRCIGTRFCSNNCPYKVRRFNYFAFAQEEQRPPISRNPDVSVRARGVMEKCTFCIQRVAQARIASDRDGGTEQVATACQAACPTQTFSFGNINDPDAEVVKRKHSPLNYVLLPEQATKPRVTYEGRILNRNPAISL